MQGFLIIKNLPVGQFVARVVGLAMRPFLAMRIDAHIRIFHAHIRAYMRKYIVLAQFGTTSWPALVGRVRCFEQRIRCLIVLLMYVCAKI